MTNKDMPLNPNDEVDPDPFAIGFALLGLLFSGATYLETRRRRILSETQRTNEFRKKWFDCRRTLIHARRVIDEFETYVAEDGYGGQDFLFGTARMNLPRYRVDQLRRLHGNAHTTSRYMADDLDAISEFLGEEYQELIEQIMDKLREQRLPHSYDAVLILAKDAIALYERLIEEIGENEGFTARRR